MRTRIVAALAVTAASAAFLLAPSPAAAAPPTPAFGPAIDAYAGRELQTGCDATPKPGVVNFRALILAAHPSTGDSGIGRACDDRGQSEHKEGRAWDWRVNVNGQAHIADDIINWLLAADRHGNPHALARRFGIMYIIWNRRIWKTYERNLGWQAYNGDNPHTDHVHFSFSWAGARMQTTWWTTPRTPAHPGLIGDWNGDGRADVGVYRPTSSMWMVPNFLNDPWGGSGDIPVAGAWNGNGRTYMGVFRNGDWLIPGLETRRWGGAGDIPVPADYNGDGRTDMAVWRPSTGQYLIPGLAPITFGVHADTIPAPADFNGDRKVEPAVFVNGTWKLQGRTERWGGAGDIPVPGDWNGDGNADIAVWRPSSGKWLIPGVPEATWGGAGDIPVPMNWNGGTRVYMTVFRNGDWLVPGRTTVRWGGRGDVPIGTTGNAAIWKLLGIRL